MDKVLFLAGASSDMATEYLEKYESKYDYIFAPYNHESERLQEISRRLENRILLLQVDFSNLESMQDMFERIKENGRIPTHIVFFSSPKFHYSKFTKLSLVEWQREIQIGFLSFVMIMQEFLPIMAKQRYGKVVVMLSSCTKDVPPKYLSHYVAVKYALLGLVKSLVAEYVEKGITINGVSPDMVETKFLSEIPGFVIEENAKRQPLKTNIPVNDVVEVIDILLSDHISFVNGQNIFITNGQ